MFIEQKLAKQKTNAYLIAFFIFVVLGSVLFSALQMFL